MRRYFALIYYAAPDFVQRRAPYREAHLQMVREWHARGDLVHGGALGDPADRALLVFRSEDRRAAEAFAAADPYVTNGLIRRWEVQPWAVVCGLREGDVDPLASTRPARGAMIARVWTASTTRELATAYRDHFRKEVLGDLKDLPGYERAIVLETAIADGVDVQVITFWHSLDAIRAFAGPDVESAVVSDTAARLLTRFDRRTRHFDVVLQDDQRG